jgi:protein-disulfide isomerase
VRLRPIISARRKDCSVRSRRSGRSSAPDLEGHETRAGPGRVRRAPAQAGERNQLPDAPKVKIDADRDRLRGNPNAPVTVVELSDFQCPCCKQAVPTLKELLAKYPN